MESGYTRMNGLSRWLSGMLLGLLLSVISQAVFAAEYTLKFATLAPPGSTWMNLLQDWGEEVKARSQGRLELKFYPGAVQGDEPDVLKKMRFGQLQGGAFAGYGIGKMNSQARVLEMPFLFDSPAEIDHVRDALTPELAKGFRDNGYELLGWMEIGYIYFFSQQPIHKLADLKQRRIWLWQGDALGEAIFRAQGLSPIPLSMPDVAAGLSTGLIDTVYCTPLAAIAVQWFTKTEYVTQVPMINGIGAMVVSARFYDSLPADLQAILRDTAQTASARLIAATRVDNATSMAVLKQEGLKFVMQPDAVDPAELTRLREATAAEVNNSGYISAAIYQQTRALLEAFRKQHPTAQAAQQAAGTP